MNHFTNLETAAENLDAATMAQLRQLPVFNGDLDDDTLAMSTYLQVAESLLASLPPKPEREVLQQQKADQIHLQSRRCRHGFLQRHAGAVYRTVMHGHHGHLALSEMSFLVAQRFPGLTPTATLIERECQFLQADKEAREIDQGMLFQAWLGLPDIGADLVSRLLQPTAKALRLLQAFQRQGELRLGAVHLVQRGHAAHLTVHNTACLNAEDNALIDDMETAVDLAMLHDGIRVCILRGGEMVHPRYQGKRVFSAGINLKHLHHGQISFLDFLLRREFGYINKMAHGILGQDDLGRTDTIHKPWIGAVDSFAIGGGAQILLACDWVIAASDTYFCLPAAKEGIVPGVANLRLARFVGTRLARQIILGGRKVYASEAEGKLLFDEIVAPGEMDAAVDRCALQLAAPAVAANKKMLALAEESLEQFRGYMAEFAKEQVLRMYSEDVLAKVKAA